MNDIKSNLKTTLKVISKQKNENKIFCKQVTQK